MWIRGLQENIDRDSILDIQARCFCQSNFWDSTNTCAAQFSEALDEINANGLLFSANMHKIVMDAMTINLANINFPSGSTVNLNSASGPLDNKYPTFGSQNKAYGRVNFIENIRYGQHLLNSRSAFDTYGGSISIGTR